MPSPTVAANDTEGMELSVNSSGEMVESAPRGGTRPATTAEIGTTYHRPESAPLEENSEEGKALVDRKPNNAEETTYQEESSSRAETPVKENCLRALVKRLKGKIKPVFYPLIIIFLLIAVIILVNNKVNEKETPQLVAPATQRTLLTTPDSKTYARFNPSSTYLERKENLGAIEWSFVQDHRKGMIELINGTRNIQFYRSGTYLISYSLQIVIEQQVPIQLINVVFYHYRKGNKTAAIVSRQTTSNLEKSEKFPISATTALLLNEDDQISLLVQPFKYLGKYREGSYLSVAMI